MDMLCIFLPLSGGRHRLAQLLLSPQLSRRPLIRQITFWNTRGPFRKFHGQPFSLQKLGKK